MIKKFAILLSLILFSLPAFAQSECVDAREGYAKGKELGFHPLWMGKIAEDSHIMLFENDQNQWAVILTTKKNDSNDYVICKLLTGIESNSLLTK